MKNLKFAVPIAVVLAPIVDFRLLAPSNNANTGNTASTQIVPSSTKASAQPATGPAQIQTVTPQTLKAEIAKNKGKVVVVNFWATWCAPCVKELPALAQLGTETDGAVLLLVSADDPTIKSKVAQVAGSKGHRVTRQISNDIDVFFAGFDPKNKDTIALPRTYIYNREGALVQTVTEDKTFAQYQTLLKPYL